MPPVGRRSPLTKKRFEIVLVNDGSPDSSLSRALKVQAELPELVVVDFARNFGAPSSHSCRAGAGGEGKEIFLIDSDLEEEPEWLSSFYEAMETHRADVVFGQQTYRKGRFGERFSGTIFYTLFNLLSATSLPVQFCHHTADEARLCRYVIAIQGTGNLPGGVFVLAGFKQDGGARE